MSTAVCRVCLAGNLELHSVDNILLRDVYEKLCNTKFISEDGRSRAVCCFCRQKLLRCHTFSVMARRSEKVISELFFKGLEATHEIITKLDLRITGNLAVSPVSFTTDDNDKPNEIAFVTIKEEPMSVKVERTTEDEVITGTEYNIGKGKPEYFLVPIKEELIVVKAEGTAEEDTLAENETAITYMSEEFTKQQMVVEADNNQDTLVPKTHKSKGANIPSRCESSSKIFLVESNLTSHIRKSYSNATPYPEPCASDKCENQLTSKTTLIAHRKSLTKEKSYYACDSCKKQFKYRSKLIQHVRTHTREKPHACNICNKQFGALSHLKEHSKTHTGEKPYACDICNKRFCLKGNLTRHRQTHSGEKPYACDRCEKQFGVKSNLKKHRITHTGEMPYACNLCYKKFSFKGNLTKHNRTHTGEKPYACNICDKQYSDKSNLRKHRRTHTGEPALSS